MALDSNIAMGFKGFQLNDPMDNYAKAATLSSMGMQNQYMQTKMDESRRLSDLAKMRQQIYAASGGDSDKLLAGLQQAGDMEGVQAYQQHLLSQQKDQADLDDKKLGTNSKRLKLISDAAVIGFTGGTMEHAGMVANMLEQNGATQEAGFVRGMMEKYPDASPEQVKAFFKPYISSQLSASELLMPKFEDVGGQKVNVNPNVQVDPLQKTQTPDSIASNTVTREGHQVTMRGQNMVDKRSGLQQSSNPYFQFLPTAEGYQVGNARTGEISSPPKAFIPATADPVLQGRIAGARTGGEATAKRDHNMTGLGDTIREAELIFSGKTPDGRKAPLPTGSGLGTAVDIGAGFFGVSPDGSEQAQQLKAISGALTSKMPRMEGPQSDKDVQMYKEMAALVGDSMVPLPRRKAALLTVKRLWGKYEKKGGESAAPNIDSLLEKYK